MAKVFKIGHKINVQNENTQRRIQTGFCENHDLDEYAVFCLFFYYFLLA